MRGIYQGRERGREVVSSRAGKHTGKGREKRRPGVKAEGEKWERRRQVTRKGRGKD
jgi:hypothetical protein